MSFNVLMKNRPDIYHYARPHEFLRALCRFYKNTSSFSLRQRTLREGNLSQSTISHILNERRSLTRDNLPAIAAIFDLTRMEQEFIDQHLKSKNQPGLVPVATDSEPTSFGRKTQNHILSDWLYPYVKDLANLHGFSPDPAKIHRMLGGVASNAQINRAVRFLLREGFWKTQPDGKVVPAEEAVITTSEIPSLNVRTFHKRALDLARKGLESRPVNERKASTVLVSVNEDQVQELRDMIDSFQYQLLKFIEQNPQGKDKLVQVSVHLTPIGESL